MSFELSTGMIMATMCHRHYRCRTNSQAIVVNIAMWIVLVVILTFTLFFNSYDPLEELVLVIGS